MGAYFSELKRAPKNPYRKNRGYLDKANLVVSYHHLISKGDDYIVDKKTTNSRKKGLNLHISE